MKLLIVEDERRARDGLYNLIVGNFPEIHALSPATNGRDGLKRIEEESPDIILTDIRMLDLDGLDMISLMPHRNPSPYVIIISGYSDFKYAQRGIRLGVQDYILKPFTTDRLIKTIQKAVDSMKSSGFLSMLMTKKPAEGETSPGCQLLFRYGYGLVENDVFPYLRKLVLRAAGGNSRLDEYSDSTQQILSFFLPAAPGTAVMPFPSVDLSRRITAVYPGRISGAWSCVPNNSERLEKLKRGLAMHRYYELPVLVCAEEILSEAEPMTVFPWQQEKNLLKDIRKGSFESTEGHFIEWLNGITSAIHPPDELAEQMERVLITLMNILKEINGQGFVRAVETHLPERVKGCLFRRDTESIFRELLSLFQVDMPVTKAANPIIQKVLLHVDTRMHEVFTLEEMAEMVQISSEYLSRLFKKETGWGFNAYVNSRKIKKARELLLADNRSIRQIAEKLGYSSPRYFARVFKKITSMTPREYRELRQD